MKPVSDQVFSFANDKASASTERRAYERCSAKLAGLAESWLRDAIFDLPDLVIGPCLAAGLQEDDWYPLQREFHTDAGEIDVLMVSSRGRLALVETKLASNPENRRKVLAQAVDYLVHLPDYSEDIIKLIPQDDTGEPVADPDDVHRAVSDGNILLIIASDEIDTHVEKLSRRLFSDRIDKQWELALIDLALYRSEADGLSSILVVPCMRGLIQSELRQVVKVIVDQGKPGARVEIERYVSTEQHAARHKWDENRYFESLGASGAPKEVQDLASKVRELAARHPDSLTLEWGTGKKGAMVLKRRDGGLIEVRASGKIRFRPPKFERALGAEGAHTYLEGLRGIAPSAMTMAYPLIYPDDAAKAARAIFDLLLKTIEDAETED